MNIHKAKKLTFTSGFTIIELIIYLGLSIVILCSLLSVVWIFINGQIKQQMISEINSNGRHVMDTITYLSQRASDVDALTQYSVNPGYLKLRYPDATFVVFGTYSKQVGTVENPVIINKLRITEGANPSVDLTSDNVDVINYTITDISPNVSNHVFRVSLTLRTVYYNVSNTYESQRTWTNTITLRAR